MESKKNVIPYLPVLDALELSSHEMVMESKALRLPIMENNWAHDYPYAPITIADLGYSSKGIYCRFWSKGIGLKAGFAEDGEHVNEDSCVEFFLQVPGSKEYYNFEFNCIGTCNASRRKSRKESTPLTPQEMEQILRATSERRGMIFDRPQGIYSFWVSILIPFELIGINIDTNLPTHIMANLYKCGDATAIPHYLSWKSVRSETPDFHRPEDFEPLYFGSR